VRAGAKGTRGGPTHRGPVFTGQSQAAEQVTADPDAWTITFSGRYAIAPRPSSRSTRRSEAWPGIARTSLRRTCAAARCAGGYP